MIQMLRFGTEFRITISATRDGSANSTSATREISAVHQSGEVAGQQAEDAGHHEPADAGDG